MRAVLDTNVLISSVISTGVTHDFVVSGDQHLLSMEIFRGIDIVDPRTFHDHLESR